MSESTSFSDAGKPTPVEDLNYEADADPSQDHRPVASSAGYFEESLYNNSILAVSFADLSRATIDTWGRRLRALRDLSTPDTPVFLMFHIADNVDVLTPYTRTKARELNLLRPQMRCFVAVVLPHTVIGQVLKAFIWSLSAGWQSSTLRVFFEKAEALMWLKRQVDYNLPPVRQA